MRCFGRTLKFHSNAIARHQRASANDGGAGSRPNASATPITKTIRSGPVLNLVLARGYLAKLLDNKQVVRYLKQRQPEVLAEFETIVPVASLE